MKKFYAVKNAPKTSLLILSRQGGSQSLAFSLFLCVLRGRLRGPLDWNANSFFAFFDASLVLTCFFFPSALGIPWVSVRLALPHRGLRRPSPRSCCLSSFRPFWDSEPRLKLARIFVLGPRSVLTRNRSSRFFSFSVVVSTRPDLFFWSVSSFSPWRSCGRCLFSSAFH